MWENCIEFLTQLWLNPVPATVGICGMEEQMGVHSVSLWFSKK